MHTALMALTSFEANDIVANSRKNPMEAWRRLQKRYDPTTGGRKRNLLRPIISPARCSPLELQAGIERWESYVSRYEKKWMDKLDDEIKLAGLETLVPEELEKHLILSSNHLGTFKDARLDIVTFVESKFGLRISDFKQSDTGSRGHSDPMDVDAVNSLSLVWQRKSVIESARWVFFSVRWSTFSTRLQCTQEHRKSNRLARANRASHGPTKSEGKGKSKENNGKPKGKSKGAKGLHKGKTSKTGLSGLEHSKSETSSETQEPAWTCPTDNSWFHDGWSQDEWNDGRSYDEWNDDWGS